MYLNRTRDILVNKLKEIIYVTKGRKAANKPETLT